MHVRIAWHLIKKYSLSRSSQVQLPIRIPVVKSLPS